MPGAMPAKAVAPDERSPPAGRRAEGIGCFGIAAAGVRAAAAGGRRDPMRASPPRASARSAYPDLSPPHKAATIARGGGIKHDMTGRIWRRLKAWVRRRKSLLRESPPARAVLALALAVICGAVVYLLWTEAERPSLAKILDADNVIAWLAAVSADGRRATPVTFIEVDELSYQGWGYPKSVPRQHVIDVLTIVDKARPAAIVLDFDITQDDASETEAVIDYLSRRDATVPLLLVRPFTRLPDGNDVRGAVVERASRIDRAAISAAGAEWVSAYLDTDEGWFSRRWRGYEVVCSDGAPRAYPAAALAATALTRDPSNGLRQLGTWLEDAAQRRCRPGEHTAPPDAAPSWARNADEGLLIPYSIGFTAEPFRFGATRVGTRALPIFSRFSAAHLVDRKQDYLAAPPDLSDRIAIVGASYEASGDWHRTPLGRMPGMYVIGNMVAFGAVTLAENRWWGLKPLLLGIGFFAMHRLASLIFRAAVALLLVAGATALLLPLLVRNGVSVTTAYEAAVIGIGIIALHAGIRAAIDAFARHRSASGTGRFGKLLFSERGREWLSATMGKREN